MRSCQWGDRDLRFIKKIFICVLKTNKKNVSFLKFSQNFNFRGNYPFNKAYQSYKLSTVTIKSNDCNCLDENVKKIKDKCNVIVYLPTKPLISLTVNSGSGIL